MRGRAWLYLLLAALLVGGAGVAVVSARGIRNNNPGNIRHGRSQWQGMAASQPDKSFVAFTEAKYGIRAMAKLLLNYQAAGVKTLRQLIAKWAPATENKTGAYVASVSKRAGIPADTPLDLKRNPAQLASLVSAMIRHENGVQPYPASTIAAGVDLARGAGKASA